VGFGAAKETGDVFTVQAPQGRGDAYVRLADGYAYMTLADKSVVSAARAPSPASFLPPTIAHDLSIVVQIAAVPEAQRQGAATALTSLLDMAAASAPAGQREVVAASKANNVKLLKAILLETASFAIHLDLDANAGTAKLEFEVTPVPGTQNAKEIASQVEAPHKSAAALLPSALGTGAFLGRSMDPTAEFEARIKNARTPIEAKAYEVARTLVGSEQSEASVSVLPGPALAVAVISANPSKTEAAVRALFAEAAKDPSVSADAIKMDAEKDGGVSLHRLKLPEKAVPENMKSWVESPIYLGMKGDLLLIGAGKDSLAVVKQVIKNAGAEKTLPTFILDVSVAGIGELMGKSLPSGAGQERVKVIGRGGEKSVVTIDLPVDALIKGLPSK
jgi:hypothetical protein